MFPSRTESAYATKGTLFPSVLDCVCCRLFRWNVFVTPFVTQPKETLARLIPLLLWYFVASTDKVLLCHQPASISYGLIFSLQDQVKCKLTENWDECASSARPSLAFKYDSLYNDWPGLILLILDSVWLSRLECVYLMMDKNVALKKIPSS